MSVGAADAGHGPAAHRRGRLLSLLGLLALAAVGFAWLGVWQVERRAWKLDLIARVEQRVHAAPVSVPPRATWGAVNEADDAYRHVKLHGRFLHDRETLVQALTERGAGYWVLTPLQADDGATILVNRGFIPLDRRDRTTRAAADPVGLVEMSGLLRTTEPGGGFLRPNDPAHDRWYSRDVSAIAAARGLVGTAPFFVDADAGADRDALPVGGLTVVAFRNDHLAYALTWFALALMAAGATLLVIREDRRSSRRDARRDVVRGAAPAAVGPSLPGAPDPAS